MASEKRVNVVIDGDASGLGTEVERVSVRMQESLKEIGFENIMDEASKRFETRIDRLKFVMDELNKEREDTQTYFNERIDKTKSSGGRKDADLIQEREGRTRHIDTAIEELRKSIDKLTKKIDSSEEKEGQGKPLTTEEPKPSEKRAEEPASTNTTIDESRGGRIGNSIGKSLQQFFNGNFKGGFKTLLGGGGRGGVGAAEGAAEEGAAGGGLLGGAIAGALIFLGIKAFQKGAEDLRVDNRLKAAGMGRDAFMYDNGTNYTDFSSIGFNRTEAKRMMLENLRGATGIGQDTKSEEEFRKQLFNLTVNRARFETAYGIDSNSQQGLDQFRRQGVGSPENVIAEIFARNRSSISSAGGQIIGGLATEKLDQIVKLLEFQKQQGERVNSRLAIDMINAGRDIGGQFSNDRGGEKIGGIVQGLSNPKGDLMKSLMFNMLSSKYGSISETLAAIENIGSNSGDLRTVTQGLGKRFGSGEIARLMFGSQFGANPNAIGSQFDVNTFFKGGGYNAIANRITGDTSKEILELPKKINQILDNVALRAKSLTFGTLAVKADNVSIVAGRVMQQAIGSETGAVVDTPTK